MKQDLFLKFFPLPKFLRTPGAGLDISDQSVKFAQLEEVGEGFSLKKYGEEVLPVGLIENGQIKNREELVKILSAFRQAHHLNYIHASLPEDQSYTFQINLPLMKKSELRDSIELQLEEYIPLSADKSVFDYTLVEDDKEKGMVVGVSALPVDLVSDYYSLLSQAGFFVSDFEVEAQAISRALILPEDKETYMVVDIGKIHTSFSVVNKGSVVYSSIIGVGGADLTRAIQRHLKISPEVAEAYKIEKGLSRASKNKEVFDALIPVVSALKDEVQVRYRYWQDHSTEVEKRSPIKQVILCGGQSSLPGLKEYLSIYLGAEVVMGNSWLNIVKEGKTVPPIDFNNSLRYTTALGLALKSYL